MYIMGPYEAFEDWCLSILSNSPVIGDRTVLVNGMPIWDPRPPWENKRRVPTPERFAVPVVYMCRASESRDSLLRATT